MKLAALTLLATGCLANGSDPVQSTHRVATDEQLDNLDDLELGAQDTSDTKPIATGVYHVRSTVDLTVEQVLPEPAENLVVTLRDFSREPGKTMFDLADDAGVPAVDTIRDALPSYVEDKLYGWIDAEIAKLSIGGEPVTSVAASIAALAETAFSSFALDTILDVDNGTHRLAHLDLAPAGLDMSFDVSLVPSVSTTCAMNDGTLVIGDHTYGLAYGEYAWTAVNAASVQRYGYDLRGALGVAVNCPALAQKIANKCVYGYCVGHATELTQICERGLDEVANRAHAKIAAQRFDALRFERGEATVTANGLDGTWTAQINAGQGLRHAPATFTATK